MILSFRTFWAPCTGGAGRLLTRFDSFGILKGPKWLCSWRGLSQALHELHNIPNFMTILVDVSDIFYFFLLGEGEGGVRGAGRRGGGGGRGRFFIENSTRGGSPGGGGPRGREGVCSKLGNWGEGGAKYFFRGRNVHQAILSFRQAIGDALVPQAHAAAASKE